MIEDLSVLTRNGNAPDISVSYGDDADQVADIRYGSRGIQLPLVVVIHGGFWKPEYDRRHAESMSTELAGSGWTVLTLEYRRIPGDPDSTLQDIEKAIHSLPPKVQNHNGKVLLMGHSAGGHLALWAATRGLDNLQGVIALSPAANLQLAHQLRLGDNATFRFLGVEPDYRPDIDPMKLAAPKVAVTIIQGYADEIVPPALAESYSAAFPNTHLVSLADAGHFSVIDPQSNAWQVVLAELTRLSGR